jgi:WD40 repeat protein
MGRRKTNHLSAGLALTMTVAIGSLFAPSAVASGPTERIAFTRLLDGGGAAILTVNADGSDEQVVPLEIPVEDFGVATWSTDQTHLLIANTIRFDGNGDLLPFRPAIVRPDGSDFRLLLMPDAPGDVYCPSWSPDSSRIYCAFGGDQPGVYSVRASDGGDPQRVTSTAFADSIDLPVDVSPDGSQIVILRKRPGSAPEPHPFKNETFALYVVNVDGSNLHQIAPYGTVLGHEIGSAHWSPNGRSIIAASPRGALFTVDPKGGSVRHLNLGIGGFAFMPNWSPDGTRIVFGLFGPESEDLYTADPNGGNVRRVTTTAEFEHGPDWR